MVLVQALCMHFTCASKTNAHTHTNRVVINVITQVLDFEEIWHEKCTKANQRDYCDHSLLISPIPGPAGHTIMLLHVCLQKQWSTSVPS